MRNLFPGGGCRQAVGPSELEIGITEHGQGMGSDGRSRDLEPLGEPAPLARRGPVVTVR